MTDMVVMVGTKKNPQYCVFSMRILFKPLRAFTFMNHSQIIGAGFQQHIDI
jgi:hypothetical protein